MIVLELKQNVIVTVMRYGLVTAQWQEWGSGNGGRAILVIIA